MVQLQAELLNYFGQCAVWQFKFNISRSTYRIVITWTSKFRTAPKSCSSSTSHSLFHPAPSTSSLPSCILAPFPAFFSQPLKPYLQESTVVSQPQQLQSEKFSSRFALQSKGCQRSLLTTGQPKVHPFSTACSAQSAPCLNGCVGDNRDVTPWRLNTSDLEKQAAQPHRCPLLPEALPRHCLEKGNHHQHLQLQKSPPPQRFCPGKAPSLCCESLCKRSL